MVFSTPDRFKILADEIDTLRKWPTEIIKIPTSTREVESGYETLLSGFHISIDDSLDEFGRSIISDSGILELVIPMHSIESLTSIIREVEDLVHLHWYSAPVSLIFSSDIDQIREFESVLNGNG